MMIPTNLTTVATMTTNADTAAIPVIAGNDYMLEISGTMGSGTITLKQEVDATNYRAYPGFSSMTAAGIQFFKAAGNNIKLNCAGGTDQNIVAKLRDLGSPGQNVDYSKDASRTSRTNS